MVFSELVIAWRLATSPTRRSPLLVNATTDGVVRAPSALGMTTGSPPSITATHEFVVPRSIPITFATFGPPLVRATGAFHTPARDPQSDFLYFCSVANDFAFATRTSDGRSTRSKSL